METTIKDRLITFMKQKGISHRKFETEVGLSNGYLSKLVNSPTAAKLQMIISTYPDLNDKWLLTGEGPMLRTPIEKTVPEVTPDTGKPFFGDLPASAGNIIQYPDITRQLPTGSINIPQAKGAEFFFPVIGMSMRPTIEEGDIIGVCHIDRYETTNAERVYMIITCDNERMIKRILGYNKEKGTITLASDNPQYPNFDLDTSLIVDIYKVVLHLKVETL